MTKGLTDFFDLPSMNDIENMTDEAEIEVAPVAPIAHTGNTIMDISEMRGEHSREMDDIHDEMIKHARDMTELAFDLDPARSPRMLEVAATFYKTAVDAKISKRDAQLKLMKLMQTQKKLDLDEMRLRHEMGNIDSEKADVVMVEDRNALLKRLRDQ